MSNEIKNVKGAIVKEINGVKYFKLVSKYPGDYTKNCGLLSSEIDENFFFLRSYDIQDMHFDENNLVLTRVDGDTIKATLPDLPEILFKKMTFEFDKSTGKLIVTYPDGTQEILEGFFVAGEDIKVATDYTIRGDGRVCNPLRISEVEKTGTYAPAEFFLDRTDGTPMPDVNKEHKGKGFRIVTKENYTPFGRLYTYDGVQKIKGMLENISSPWRIPTRKDWADLLNAAEYCDEDRNHDTLEINVWTGKYAGGRAKSANSWKLVEEGGEEVSYSDDNLPTTGSYSTFHIIPIGYGEGSRGVLAEDWNDDIEGLTKLSSYWTDTPTGSHFKSVTPNIFTRTFSYDTREVLQESSKPSSRLSLRLVKDYDYDCLEFNEYDYILGDSVPTLLISNPEIGYSKIWTSVNIGLSNPEFSGVTSVFWNKLSGEDREVKEVFYINEWNGKEWVKKQMRPGDSVVILDYDGDTSTSGDTYHEWRVYETSAGTVELIDTAESLKEEFQEEIDELNEKVDELSAKTEEITESLEEEIIRAQSAETILAEAIDELDEKVDEEITRSISADTYLQEEIDSIKIVEIEPTSSDVLKSYELHINDETKGVTIDIPKDKSIKEIRLGHSGATINTETGEITDGPDENPEVLLIAYQRQDGKFELAVIDLEDFIIENEFGDGLVVENNIVSVLKDPESDEFLQVGPNGVLLSGVTDKFNELDEKIDAEIERAISAETIVQQEIDTLSGEVTTLSGSVVTLSGNVNTLSGSVETLSAACQESEYVIGQSLNDLNTKINELSGNVETLSSSTVGIQTGLTTLSASTIDEINRLDGKDIVESGSTLNVKDGLSLARQNGEIININMKTSFGLLPEL